MQTCPVCQARILRIYFRQHVAAHNPQEVR
jgi:hypothetical protein